MKSQQTLVIKSYTLRKFSDDLHVEMTTFCAHFDFISQEKLIKSKTRSFIIATLHVTNIRSFADCQSRFVIDGTRSQCFCMHSLRSVRIVQFSFHLSSFFLFETKFDYIFVREERNWGDRRWLYIVRPSLLWRRKKQFIFCSFFS